MEVKNLSQEGSKKKHEKGEGRRIKGSKKEKKETKKNKKHYLQTLSHLFGLNINLNPI